MVGKVFHRVRIGVCISPPPFSWRDSASFVTTRSFTSCLNRQAFVAQPPCEGQASCHLCHHTDLEFHLTFCPQVEDAPGDSHFPAKRSCPSFSKLFPLSHIPGRLWIYKSTLKTHFEIFSLVAQAHPTLCDLMDCSTPSFPVHHQLLELAQTHVHRVSDALKSYLKTKYGYLGTCTG